MENNPWKGYFPIPNNHNRSRLFHSINDLSQPYRYPELNAMRDILYSIPEELLCNAFFSYTKMKGRLNEDNIRFMLKWQNLDNTELLFRLDNVSYEGGKLLFSEYIFIPKEIPGNGSYFTSLELVSVYRIKEDKIGDFIYSILKKLTHG